uniref:EOG090X07YB n=1 Tax=Simocephalus serrulatus TaxID=117539 RepID=A0A4Y7NM31_9CRUS|nr:EOG090X07YB [Simocephalus serrulatus]SVE94300.1 EOG090X07YB [Simocephalus serrulatus]
MSKYSAPPSALESDDEFKNRIHSVSDTLDMCRPEESDEDNDTRESESMILMQIFSPLLTSYRIMNQEFQNSYDCISCEDGSTVAFYEQMGFLLIAVAKSTVNAVHLARVCFTVMQHVVGPSLSVLKHSDTHSELASTLIATFLKLRQTSQSIVTESLHYEPISEGVNSSILRVLQVAVTDLYERGGIPENRTHILIIKETSIVAIYSGKGTSELKMDEILFLIIVTNAFDHSSTSTRHSLIILESCVPYTIHIQRVENGLNVVVLIEGGLHQLSNNLFTLLKSVCCSPIKPESIPKQLKQLQKMAYKLNQRHWFDMLVWRPEQSQNQSAMSALARQILHGFEIICLNPSLLFAAVEHVSGVIDDIQLSIPIQSLSQPCRLTPLLKIYPGLVHFVLIDRKNHRMISPCLSQERHDSTFENMWKIFHTSLEWLNEGMYSLLWNDKQLCYSHTIWIEDTANKKLPWKSSWDIQTGTLGYPALIGSGFYEIPPRFLSMATVLTFHQGFFLPKTILIKGNELNVELSIKGLLFGVRNHILSQASFASASESSDFSNFCSLFWTSHRRHFYTEPQLALLEAEFAAQPFPNKDGRRSIAMQLGVSEKSVMWWFQNRRRRARNQSKSAANPPSVRARRQRRSATLSSCNYYQPEYQQNSSRDEWAAYNSTSWPNWSYPSAHTVTYPEEQPTDYSSVSVTSPFYQEDCSPITNVQSPEFTSPGWAIDNQFRNNVDTCNVGVMTCYNYPTEFQPDVYQYQPTFSNWTNWEYTPPFYPGSSSMETPSPSTQQDLTNYSAPYCYYPAGSTEYL